MPFECKNPNCRSTDPTSFILSETRGDIVCRRCGTVLRGSIQHQSEEKRTFQDTGGSKDRTSLTNTFDGALGTGTTTLKGMNGENIKVRSIEDAKTKALKKAKMGINDMCNHLELPEKIQQKARAIWKQMYEAKEGRKTGIYTTSMYAAVVQQACKEEAASMDLQQLSKSLDINVNEIKGSSRQLNRTLEGRPKTYSTVSVTEDFVKRFCSAMKKRANARWMETFMHIAVGIARNAVSHLEGRQPKTIACVALLLAAVHTKFTPALTIKDISTAASCSVSSIQGAKKLLEPIATDLLPDDFEELSKLV